MARLVYDASEIGGAMGTGSACGKAILLGEHAVVYGWPAIAVPLTDLRAHATVLDSREPVIEASDLNRVLRYESRARDSDSRALWQMLALALGACGGSLQSSPLRVVLQSDVPVARGLGSGTAVATAITRAVADHMRVTLDADAISEIVFESEVLLHGTPSGIDNTVVAWERPVWFVKGALPEALSVETPLHLVVGDTGVVSGTREAVAGVRAARERDRVRVDGIVGDIGELAGVARGAILNAGLAKLGVLMNRNHRLLQEMGVSCPELDRLVIAAREAGALGAKLSGGGLGGCMVALVTPGRRQEVASALRANGASQVYCSSVSVGGCKGGSAC